jgi:hypothetical protein
MNNTNYQRLTKEQLAARVVGDIFDGAVVKEYLTSNLAKPPSTSERLREFLEGKAAPLNVPGAKNAG